jgi:hypothetical protein
MKNLKRCRIGPLSPILFPRDPLKYFKQGFNKFGDTYKLGLFQDFLVTRDPAIFKYTFVTHAKNYQKLRAKNVSFNYPQAN